MKEQHGKKYVAAPESVCIYCRRNGHAVHQCICAPLEAKEDMPDWAWQLIKQPTPDIATLYAGKSLKDVMRAVDKEGERLNKGNPWAVKNPQRRDLLRARLGWWKAIGTDEVVLTWIAGGSADSVLK